MSLFKARVLAYGSLAVTFTAGFLISGGNLSYVAGYLLGVGGTLSCIGHLANHYFTKKDTK